jgi:hypothetical protein
MLEQQLGPHIGKSLAKAVVLVAALAFILACLAVIGGIGYGAYRFAHSGDGAKLVPGATLAPIAMAPAPSDTPPSGAPAATAKSRPATAKRRSHPAPEKPTQAPAIATAEPPRTVTSCGSLSVNGVIAVGRSGSLFNVPGCLNVEVKNGTAMGGMGIVQQRDPATPSAPQALPSEPLLPAPM